MLFAYTLAGLMCGFAGLLYAARVGTVTVVLATGWELTSLAAAVIGELPGGIHLRGGPAWLAWLGLHLVFLVGKRNRASVLLNWAWNYLTWDRGPRLLFRPGEQEDEPR